MIQHTIRAVLTSTQSEPTWIEPTWIEPTWTDFSH